MIYLESQEELDWLAEVHTPLVKEGYVVAALKGNEDSPDEIHLFARNHYECAPTVLYRAEDGSYVVHHIGEQPTPAVQS